jgi:hypothetical protein
MTKKVAYRAPTGALNRRQLDRNPPLNPCV